MDDQNIAMRTQGPPTLTQKPRFLPQLTETFLGVLSRSKSQMAAMSANLVDKGERFKAEAYEDEVVARQPPWMQNIYSELLVSLQGAARALSSPSLTAASLDVSSSNESSTASLPNSEGSSRARFRKPPLQHYDSAPRLPVTASLTPPWFSSFFLSAVDRHLSKEFLDMFNLYSLFLISLSSILQ